MFRACSVATSLVTSLNFNPIHCPTSLRQFGQLRNGCVVTHFINFSSTTTISVTSEYVSVPGCIGQNEEPASRNDKQAMNNPSSTPKAHLNEVQYDRMYIWACKYEFLVKLLFILMNIINFFHLGKILWYFFSYYCLLCRRGNKHFNVHFWEIRPHTFSVERWKSVGYEGRFEWKSVHFSQELAFSLL